jgi:integrase/recombinase XerD
MLRVLASFYRWATERQLVLLDPTRDIELIRPGKPALRRLTPDQVLAVLEAPDPTTPLGLRDRALLATFYATGIRRRECHMLDLADYDRTDQSLAVRHAKGGSMRKLPVLPHLAEMLEDYLDLGRPFLRTRRGERAMFIASQTGQRLCYNQIYNLVTDYGRTAGVELTVHMLRHACATHLLAGGAELEHVRQLLGHARLESTQRYTAVSAEDIARTHRRSHPRGQKPAKKEGARPCARAPLG